MSDKQTLEYMRIMHSFGIKKVRLYQNDYIYTLNRGDVCKCMAGGIVYLGSV